MQFEECFSIFLLLIQLPVGKEKVERAEVMLRNLRCLKTLVYNPNPHSSMVMVHRKEVMDTGCQVSKLPDSNTVLGPNKHGLVTYIRSMYIFEILCRGSTVAELSKVMYVEDQIIISPSFFCISLNFLQKAMA